MSEQRYIQKGWEIDSITPIFKDDPSASEVGEVESVYVLTADEWAKWQALYSAINDVVIQCGAVGSIEARGDRMQSLMDALYKIDGGVYDAKHGKAMEART